MTATNGGGMRKADGGYILQVRVTPRASRNEMRGWHGGALKVRLRAPPVDGKANEALVDFLAEALEVPRSRVAILAGGASRLKSVFVPEDALPRIPDGIAK